MEQQHDHREIFAEAYEDIERMCARKANVYRDQLEGLSDDLDSDCVIMISAKIAAIEEVRYASAEKAKVFHTLALSSSLH